MGLVVAELQVNLTLLTDSKPLGNDNKIAR